MVCCGVLHAAYVLPSSGTNLIRELVATAAHLRELLSKDHNFAMPMDLVATRVAVHKIPWLNGSLTLWDQVREVEPLLAAKPAIEPYLFKLRALITSRFTRTLFLDCDLVVIERSFVTDLLGGVLDVADVAMPLDPGRAWWLTGGGRGAPWVAPAVTPPMLCTAVTAYRQNAQVIALFEGAERRLREGLHPRVRQSDQEMIWFEWTSGNSSTLRVLALPEETYCPIETTRGNLPDSKHPAFWSTSWPRGNYPCRAVHSHKLAHSLVVQLPTKQIPQRDEFPHAMNNTKSTLTLPNDPHPVHPSVDPNVDQSSTSPNVTLFYSTSNVHGRAYPTRDRGVVRFLGTFNTIARCQHACVKYQSAKDGAVCHSFTFHHADLPHSVFAGTCFAIADHSWQPKSRVNNITSGRVAWPMDGCGAGAASGCLWQVDPVCLASGGELTPKPVKLTVAQAIARCGSADFRECVSFTFTGLANTSGPVQVRFRNHTNAVRSGGSGCWSWRKYFPIDACATLPFAWIPGLPVSQNPRPFEYYRDAPRIEVSHLRLRERQKWTARTLWLYEAVGSATWWEPGRRLVKRNAIDAVLHFTPFNQLVARYRSLESSSTPAGNHVRRWRVALGNLSWEDTLSLAANGTQCFGLMAMAVYFIKDLPPIMGVPGFHKTYELTRQTVKEAGIDSLIMYEQSHLWPRPHDSSTNQFSELGEMVAECLAGKRHKRLHKVPEIIDYRVVGPSAVELMRNYSAASENGSMPCQVSPWANYCTSCTRAGQALCACIAPYALSLNASTYHTCCKAMMTGALIGTRDAHNGVLNP